MSVIGSTVTAKGVATLYGKNSVTIESTLDEHSASAGGSKKGFLSSKSFSYGETRTTNVSSVVSAGTQLNVISQGDVTVRASHLASKNDINVLAGFNDKGEKVQGAKGNVNILSGTDGTGTEYSQKKSGLGLFFTGGGVDFYRSRQTTATMTQGENVASSVMAGGNLRVESTRDVNIIGSTLSAKGFTSVKAGRDLDIGPGEDSSTFAFSKKEKGVGFTTSAGEGSASVSFGYHARSDFFGHGQTKVAPSIIFGGKGVSLTGGHDVTIVAARIASPGHVGIKAVRGDLDILAGANTEQTYQSTKEVFAGITLKVSENVSGAVRQLQQAPATAASGYGGGGFKAIAGISGVLQTVDAIKQLSSPYVGVGVTIGASGTRSQSMDVSSTAVGTSIKAGSLSLEAGDDIRLQGVQATVKGDVTIRAKDDLVIESAQSYAASSSSSSSWHAGVGVQMTVVGTSPGGVTVAGGVS
jgi:Hemagglutinin repeat